MVVQGAGERMFCHVTPIRAPCSRLSACSSADLICRIECVARLRNTCNGHSQILNLSRPTVDPLDTWPDQDKQRLPPPSCYRAQGTPSRRDARVRVRTARPRSLRMLRRMPRLPYKVVISGCIACSE